MMNKNEIKFVRAFLIEENMTQKELAREAGICDKTLYTALKTGKVSDRTFNKILGAMLDKTIHKSIEQNQNQSRYNYIIYFIWILSISLLSLCLISFFR